MAVAQWIFKLCISIFDIIFSYLYASNYSLEIYPNLPNLCILNIKYKESPYHSCNTARRHFIFWCNEFIVVNVIKLSSYTVDYSIRKKMKQWVGEIARAWSIFMQFSELWFQSLGQKARSWADTVCMEASAMGSGRLREAQVELSHVCNLWPWYSIDETWRQTKMRVRG